MTQKEIITNIKEKLGFEKQKDLAAFLNSMPSGFTYSMTKEKAGQPVVRLCEIISACLNELPEGKIEKIKEKLSFPLDRDLAKN